MNINNNSTFSYPLMNNEPYTKKWIRKKYDESGVSMYKWVYFGSITFAPAFLPLINLKKKFFG
jgi:hypothetical protein